MTAFERVSRPYAAPADPTVAEVVSALDRLVAGLREELAYVRYERQIHADIVSQLEQAYELLRQHDRANLLLLEVAAGKTLADATAADAGERTGAHHVIEEATAG